MFQRGVSLPPPDSTALGHVGRARCTSRPSRRSRRWLRCCWPTRRATRSSSTARGAPPPRTRPTTPSARRSSRSRRPCSAAHVCRRGRCRCKVRPFRPCGAQGKPCRDSRVNSSEVRPRVLWGLSSYHPKLLWRQRVRRGAPARLYGRSPLRTAAVSQLLCLGCLRRPK